MLQADTRSSLLVGNEMAAEKLNNGQYDSIHIARSTRLMIFEVQTFRTRRLAIGRLKEMRFSFVRPEKVYDPEDLNADATGHTWVISMSLSPEDDKLYLCTNGCVR